MVRLDAHRLGHGAADEGKQQRQQTQPQTLRRQPQRDGALPLQQREGQQRRAQGLRGSLGGGAKGQKDANASDGGGALDIEDPPRAVIGKEPVHGQQRQEHGRSAPHQKDAKREVLQEGEQRRDVAGEPRHPSGGHGDDEGKPRQEQRQRPPDSDSKPAAEHSETWRHEISP
ncbi:MAG: hypothetical protein AAGG09_13810 [Pseudomonadota bacterium]